MEAEEDGAGDGVTTGYWSPADLGGESETGRREPQGKRAREGKRQGLAWQPRESNRK